MEYPPKDRIPRSKTLSFSVETQTFRCWYNTPIGRVLKVWCDQQGFDADSVMMVNVRTGARVTSRDIRPASEVVLDGQHFALARRRT